MDTTNRLNLLRQLLDIGSTINERDRGGLDTDWTIIDHHDPDIRRVHAAHLNSINPFPVPAFDGDRRYNTPEYLAAHLNNRAHGFGYTLTVYCMDCGEAQIPIEDVASDDPVCPSCETRRQAYAEMDAEDRYESALARWAETGTARKR